MTETPTELERPSDNGPQGIGGWLLLPVLSLVLFPVLSLWNFGKEFAKGWAEGEASGGIATVAHEDPLKLPLLIFFALFVLGSAIYAVYCLLRLAQKKRSIPTLMTIYYCLLVMFALWNLALLRHYPDLIEKKDDLESAIKSLIKTIIGSAIWIPYFHKSVRVKNTFVN